MQYPKSDYIEYPKSLPEDDYWGQVRRTVNGRPVSEEQIAMIVAGIQSGLQLGEADRCLDLACGNGALSSRLYAHCATLHGVDFSPYLIEVATKRFMVHGKSTFAFADAASYVQQEPDPTRFDKVLCYGSFSYFSSEDAFLTLQKLNQRFTNVQRVLIGNLPDRDRAHLFYPKEKDYAQEINSHSTQIGLWRSEQEFRALAESTGWKFQCSRMPPAFYGSHYRFDAVLYR